MAHRGYFYRVNRKLRFLLTHRRNVKVGSKKQEHKLLFPIIFVNSLFAFLIAYLAVSIFFNLSTIIASTAFNIPTLLSFYKVSFIVKGTGWSSDAVKIIFSAGPLMVLLLGIMMLFLYQHVSHEIGVLKLAVLWMFAHSVVYFLGEVMIGALFSEGFGYVLMYMYANDTLVMVITVLALCGMIAAGIIFTRLFMVTANTYFNDLPHRLNRKFLLYQFFFPFIAGSVVIYLVKFPMMTIYEICVNATMIFLLLPVVIRGGTMSDFYFDEDDRKVRIYLPMVLISVFILVLFRLVLSNGIRLIM